MVRIERSDDYRLSAEALSQFSHLREQAVHFAMAAGARAQADYYARLDQRARTAWAEDLGFHLDFIRPVLEEGDLSPFASYLVWLAEVLDSRGVPPGSIARSLDDLAEFFNERMGDAAAPIIAALLAGKATIEGTAEPGRITIVCVPCPGRKAKPSAKPPSRDAIAKPVRSWPAR